MNEMSGRGELKQRLVFFNSLNKYMSIENRQTEQNVQYEMGVGLSM